MSTISLQELRRRLYKKAKAEKAWRFWGLYIHVCKIDVLQEAYAQAKANDGSPGIDGKSFEDIEKEGIESFLIDIQKELVGETYKPTRNRRVEIPKDNGKTRVLGIPTIKDRVVQGAVKLILEPIFEADFQDGSYGYRPKRNPHQALKRVDGAIGYMRMTTVIDVDLKSYFDNIRHHILLAKLAARISDPKVLRLTKLILRANGKQGVPQGGVFSPLLANVYLNSIDQMLERAREVTREGRWQRIEYARFADDMVVLIDGHPNNRKWIHAVQKRLKEELDKLEVEMNPDKTKVVDLKKGEKFNFLGFTLIMGKSRTSGKEILLLLPQTKKRVELIRAINEKIRGITHWKIRRIVEEINPILAGWVNYYRVGNSSKAFNYVRDWMEKKIRKVAARQRKSKGYGWNRWGSTIIYRYWGLYNDYKVTYLKWSVRA